MRASWYARALIELARKQGGDEAELVDHFVATVRKNGHAHMLPKIVKSFERQATLEREKSTITVTSTTLLDEKEVLALLKKEPFKNALSARHKKVVRKTDASLIGGIVVTASGVRIDGSYKRMLADLYQDSITR